ncbi:hypothetical protein DPMN_191407 [Dreissena polymorpha]|uniref:Uncharacterized protein n=1 Tax=Dreissena polymorpha TaxID=45954 RepID=A0A9D3Y501_DREPO|nr:hypothetical protein DPMN_191407 [Dreissena polymorpha]
MAFSSNSNIEASTSQSTGAHSTATSTTESSTLLYIGTGLGVFVVSLLKELLSS